jgi:hypothetical protein
MLKVIVSRDCVSTVTIGGYSLGHTHSLLRIGITLVKSRVKKIRHANRGTVDVKWLVLDFTLL